MRPATALQGSLEDEELSALEARVQGALSSGRQEGLRILGYGEISCVLALEARAGHFACKRLPRFESAARFERYARTFHDYLQALSGRGVEVLDSQLRTLPGSEGGLYGYCIQPILPRGALAPDFLRGCGAQEGRALARRLVDTALRVISPRLGLDAQLSNWAWLEGRLRYLDVTTPLMRDEAGRDALDQELFLSSLPWLLRAPVKAFLVREITSQYHSPRGALLDLVANLHKERLEPWIPTFLELINPRVSPALTQQEAARHYRWDARRWALLQRLRRLDRAWQRAVRRRPYPFILPGHIAR